MRLAFHKLADVLDFIVLVAQATPSVKQRSLEPAFIEGPIFINVNTIAFSISFYQAPEEARALGEMNYGFALGKSVNKISLVSCFSISDIVNLGGQVR